MICSLVIKTQILKKGLVWTPSLERIAQFTGKIQCAKDMEGKDMEGGCLLAASGTVRYEQGYRVNNEPGGAWSHV